MVQVNVNPKQLADLLFNAHLLSEVPTGTHGIEMILLEVTGWKLRAYAAGSHTAGCGAIDLIKENEEPSESVVITRAEAETLQKLVRATSSAKGAQIIVEISEDGVAYADENDQEYTANMVVTWNDDDLCALQDADPEGACSANWERLDELVLDSGKSVERLSFTGKSIGVLNKIKPAQEYITLRPGKERTAVALAGNWRVVIGDSRPDPSILTEQEAANQQGLEE